MNRFIADKVFHGVPTLVGLRLRSIQLGKLGSYQRIINCDISGLVNNRDEFKLFTPLGCGYQTGASTVTSVAGATQRDSLVG